MTEPDKLIPRHATTRLRVALKDTRVVVLVGPRQSGKSTLASKIATEIGMRYLSLDDHDTLANANEDPRGFFKDLNRAVIDEIQRQPNLILALKRSVDTDTRPGRFILTGSVDLFRTMVTPDSLAGRIEIIELLPFSQTEIENTSPTNFLEKAFASKFESYREVGYTEDIIERVIRGGYPEALRKPDIRRQRNWMKSYIKGLASRDVSSIGEINKIADFEKLFDRLAKKAGQIIMLDKIAKDIEVDKKTVDRWLTLLENMFLIRRVRPWFRNNLKQLIKKPKLHYIETVAKYPKQNHRFRKFQVFGDFRRKYPAIWQSICPNSRSENVTNLFRNSLILIVEF